MEYFRTSRANAANVAGSILPGYIARTLLPLGLANDVIPRWRLQSEVEESMKILLLTSRCAKCTGRSTNLAAENPCPRSSSQESGRHLSHTWSRYSLEVDRRDISRIVALRETACTKSPTTSSTLLMHKDSTYILRRWRGSRDVFLGTPPRKSSSTSGDCCWRRVAAFRKRPPSPFEVLPPRQAFAKPVAGYANRRCSNSWTDQKQLASGPPFVNANLSLPGLAGLGSPGRGLMMGLKPCPNLR